MNLNVAKFKMLCPPIVLELFSRGQLFVVLDPKDANFHIVIHNNHKKFLRFYQGSQIYEYTILSLGLATSLRIFTKCVAGAVVYLRTTGCAVFPYLEKWETVNLPFRDTCDAFT